MYVFRFLATMTAAVVLPMLIATAAEAQGILRIAMTAGDVPTTTGAPSQGLEGVRFAGYPVFEPLVMWDLRVTDTPPGIIPWLATAWSVDPTDHNKWIFELRPGVKFQDGSEFNADAVVWNLDRFFKQGVPQYAVSSAGGVQAQAAVIASWEKIDDRTVAIFTKTPTTYFPEVVAGILMASPAQWQKLGGNWQAFAAQPSGTGPFQISAVDRTSITMVKNPGYWNVDRQPKLDKIVLYPMAEATTRLAALRSDQVDWIEVPPPDAIPGLKSDGFTVATSPMPHIWPYWLKIANGSPFEDVRVRQALNYAMDRDGLVALLNGAAEPAKGFWKQNDPRFGKPKNDYSYNPQKAKALLAEAGYPDGTLVKVKVLISTSGSGQMLPLPMNELLQESAKAAGFDLEFSVVEWGQMAAIRSNPNSAEMRDVTAINGSFTTADMTWMYYSFYPPNWSGYANPETVALMDRYKTDFDVKDKTALLARIHEHLVDDAPWVWIVHDVNPRAFSSKVKGYTPAQSWYTDLTTVYMQ